MQANIIQQKRFTGETKLLEKQPLHYITAYQDKENTLTWYFLIKGQKDSPYVDGEYIGKIVHNTDYPAKPPKYFMMTPNGRFIQDAELCLSNSSYHPETWSSNWNIISILIAFYSVFIDDKENGAGFVHPSPPDSERRKLASQSIEFNKKYLANIYNKFNFTHLKVL
jgi:ubiquitin-protein ligase